MKQVSVTPFPLCIRPNQVSHLLAFFPFCHSFLLRSSGTSLYPPAPRWGEGCTSFSNQKSPSYSNFFRYVLEYSPQGDALPSHLTINQYPILFPFQTKGCPHVHNQSISPCS